jgi:methionyl-tRNA formyltransferase
VRTVFAGSPAAAVPPLRALAGSHHEVLAVVTQPDRPRGRSGTPRPTPVAEAAAELGIPVERPATINDPDVIARLAGTGADTLCVAAFGQILRAPVLDAFRCVNVHYSLLPAYRGAAPVERAIMDGRAETGVTIMQIDPGLDTGPTILSRATPIDPEEDAGALTARLAEIGGPLLVEALDGLASGALTPRPQPDAGVSVAAKIGPDDRPLDPALGPRALTDRVRALSPHIGALCTIDGRPFKVWRVAPREGPAAPGLTREDGRLLLGCDGGAVELLELQPPGKGRMAAGDFLRGYRGPLAFGVGA